MWPHDGPIVGPRQEAERCAVGGFLDSADTCCRRDKPSGPGFAGSARGPGAGHDDAELPGHEAGQRPPGRIAGLERQALRAPKRVALEPVALPVVSGQLVAAEDAHELEGGVRHHGPASFPVSDGALSDPEKLSSVRHRKTAEQASIFEPGTANSAASTQGPGKVLRGLQLRIMYIM